MLKNHTYETIKTIVWHNTLKSLVIKSLVITSTIFLISCHSNNNIHELKKICFTDSVTTTMSSSPKIVNFVVDRSASVRGFITVNDNQFIRTIQDIVQNIPKTIKINFFELNSHIRPVNLDILSSLNRVSQSSYYIGVQTNIATLLSNKEIKDTENLTFVFSDWIHSMKDDLIANQMVVFSRDLREFIEKNGLFGIFGKEIPFSGIYFIECKKPSTINLINSSRPFFCIVFGSKKHSEFLKKYLEPFYDKEIIIGADEKLNSKFIYDKRFEGFKDFTPEHDTLNTAIIELVSDSINFSIKTNDDFKFDYSLELGCEAFYVKFNSIIQIKEFKNFKIQLDSVIKLDKGTEYFIKIKFFQKPSEDLFLKISFLQKIPDWINTWSTNCDNSENEAKKVYQLNRWIDKYIFQDIDRKLKTVFHKYIYIRR
ncbi:MAG: hypothetical protein FJW56_00435 [Actinobacteria bacterium]|nr:hypothetical protein [Actinomycetota bacterium]